MEIAMEHVLADIESDVGWICLLEEDGRCWPFIGKKGFCLADEEDGANPCLVGCVCHEVQKKGEIVLIDPLHPACPLFQLRDENNRLISGHVSIPLTAKGRVVGQLNIAFPDRSKLSNLDMAFLSALGPQLGVAIENARLWEEVRRKDAARAELLKKVVGAQEEERRRIARGLHDEMGQMLTSLLVGLKVMEKSADPEETRQISDRMKHTVNQMLDAIHDLAVELRPSVLDDLGLVPAIEDFAQSCPTRLGIQVEVSAAGMNGHRLSYEVETTLYRIVQEAITNVARHAQTNQARVLFELRAGSVVAIVEDAGRGFNVEKVLSAPQVRERLGLCNMEERAALIGGKVEIESKPGKGTTLFVQVPVRVAVDPEGDE
jgi:signal transduction histidine kinase